ncbi:hypothetical protein ESCO_003794 [Escovopsis weberi]|uniref:GPI anchored protein n=1 Tax=Escovopsis weberi TaxID=150374 RepID=A0A0N0RU85_ESCWE|nr:hypothetical protein ESCO_003794 [Escovopsis weberi]
MRALVLLASVGLISALKSPLAQSVSKPLPHSVTMPGDGSSSALLSARQAFCSLDQVSCDADGCMAAGAECCGVGNGAYCDHGYYCVPGGCCQNGQTCSGPATGCLGDREPCGNYCVDKGTCSGGGTGGGSAGSGGSQCPRGYEFCDEDCMPTGSVCCHNGFHCDAGQVCLPDAKCQLGGSGSGSDSGSKPRPPSSSTSSSTSPSSSAAATASPTYVLTPHGPSTATGPATGFFAGGLAGSTSKATSTPATSPTTAPSAPTSAPGSGGHGESGSSGSAPTSAALVHAPSVLAASFSLALLFAVLF